MCPSAPLCVCEYELVPLRRVMLCHFVSLRDKIERCERDLSYARRKHALKKQEFEAAEKEMNDHVRSPSLCFL